MTALLTSPRRFPSYSCDRDPQPLFDELDALLAEFGVFLTVKQEERLRRRFARSTLDLRGQAEILVPFVNVLLAQTQREHRLIGRPGEYVLAVPEPPRPAPPRTVGTRPSPPRPPSFTWNKPAYPASDDDKLYRFVLLVLMLGTPLLWLTCVSSFEPRSLGAPPRTQAYQRLMQDVETRRYLDQLTRDLERQQVELEARGKPRHMRPSR